MNHATEVALGVGKHPCRLVAVENGSREAVDVQSPSNGGAYLTDAPELVVQEQLMTANYRKSAEEKDEDQDVGVDDARNPVRTHKLVFI